MEHAAAVAQLRAHGQLGFGAFRRAMEDIHAEEPGECGYIGERHCRSSAAVDVLIAWRVSGASRMRDRKRARGMHDLVVQSASGIQRRSSLERPPALVAQLDRAPDFESGGRGFESLRARQPKPWRTKGKPPRRAATRYLAGGPSN